MEGNGGAENIESDEMKLSEEVDGQVTREWKSCESDQGGSNLSSESEMGHGRERKMMITIRKKEDINKSKSLDSLHGRAGRESNHKWKHLAFRGRLSITAAIKGYS
ncbi:unnamed protein product [Prunus armeniaca]